MCAGRLIFNLNIHSAFVFKYMTKYEVECRFPLFVIRQENDVKVYVTN
jgi:hypothetical protein